MNRFFVILAITTCFIVAGCSRESPLNSGVVVDKNYQPEKRWTQIWWVPASKSIGYIPIYHCNPARWTIVIQDAADFGGGPRQRELHVPREIYEKVSIGDTFTFGATHVAKTCAE